MFNFFGEAIMRDVDVLKGRSLFDFFGEAIVMLGLKGRSLFDFLEGRS